MKAILLGLSLFPLAVLAGEKIDKQIDVPSGGTIFIENQRGDIHITGWDKNEFKVSGELDDKAKGYELKTNGDKTQFIVKMPRKSNWGNNGDGSSLTIFMPKSSSLEFAGVNVSVTAKELKNGAEVDVVNGEITVDDITGNIKLTTVNGDVNAENLNGNIQFETVNGEINDRESSGELRFSAVNGDIKSTSSANDVRLENVNGDIKFTLSAIKNLRINTVNGEAEVQINELLKGGDVRFESVSGDADFYFPQSVSAKFEIEAHANGKIINKFSSDKVSKAKYGPASDLEFSINGGNANVEMNTISGRIELRTK
ncbi:DUF4097 family beta strand repeat-containing protein [Pseudoalteromonas fuliginea]|uniref:DUF4097 domain-containing protein n=1 Tax=Pseudoalteromonas fuliginea TaxID=1872678 RepID=A0ABQ6RDB7_9GAMM|nr:DUF4097 family beta strand repeat-containing protein [Pseudoalteromonas fuliginea]KAA1150529.1 hypothetical protein EU509_20755 [Pseudoalteromonas fuliginea]KAA1165268.1 hypothetical protein EUZ79_20740 [Pseudoalteromonas fuliginea]